MSQQILPSIFVVDDAIPIGSEPWFDPSFPVTLNILNSKELNLNDWGDDIVRNLIIEVNKNTNFADNHATISPEYLIAMVQKKIINPSIIVFDWEYHESAPPYEQLLILLKETCSVIIIYTNNPDNVVFDQTQEEALNNYRNRFKVVKKEVESIINTLEGLNQDYSSHFVYAFGKEIRDNVFKSTESILVALANYTQHELVTILGSKSIQDSSTDETRELLPIDIVPFISEKIRNALFAAQITTEIPVCTRNQTLSSDDISVMRNLWKERLYSNFEHSKVLRGDILQKEGLLYLVLNGDCDLARFWRNKPGLLRLALLRKLPEGASFVKKKYLEEIWSIADGYKKQMFMLPFIECGETDCVYVIDGSIESIPIAKPNGVNCETEPLKHQHIPNSNKITHFNEPFLSSLIQTMLFAMTGVGGPDLPITMKTLLGETVQWVTTP